MKKIRRKAKPMFSPDETNYIRDYFYSHGICFSEWAREQGFNPKLVFEILYNRNKAIRGKSYHIGQELKKIVNL